MTMTATVMTVAGPLPAADMGITNAHEHLLLRLPGQPGQELDSPERSAAEVLDAAGAGLAAIVELSPIGLGRRPDALRDISATTGVHIVAATGYHRDAHYPDGHWVNDAPLEVLVDRMVTDLAIGMHLDDWVDGASRDGASRLDRARAGVIKAGASYQHITAGEARRLEAAAIASKASGAAVVVHAEVGTCGHDIVDALVRAGMPTARIVLAHMDRNPDVELHLEIAARGVTLVYDTVGRVIYHPESTRIDLIESMVQAGHGSQVLVGCDLGLRSYHRAYGGGPGMRYLLDVFVPRLRRRIGAQATDAILVANPARVFALAEP